MVPVGRTGEFKEENPESIVAMRSFGSLSDGKIPDPTTILLSVNLANRVSQFSRL